jgi:histidinol dehydrogenase
MPEYLKRAAAQPEAISQAVRDAVSEILLAVRREGEPAVRRYSQALDGWSPDSFRVDPEIASCATTLTTRSSRFAASPRRSARRSPTSRSRRSPASSSATATSRSTPSAPTRRAASTR